MLFSQNRTAGNYLQVLELAVDVESVLQGGHLLFLVCSQKSGGFPVGKGCQKRRPFPELFVSSISGAREHQRVNRVAAGDDSEAAQRRWFTEIRRSSNSSTAET